MHTDVEFFRVSIHVSGDGVVKFFFKQRKENKGGQRDNKRAETVT